jgi:uncharacterized DUF497 family protein
LRFEWDPRKNRGNRRKHGISFEEATRLFTSGVDYLEIFDEAHSGREDRFIAVGLIRRGTIVVVYSVSEDDVVRIVSARMATRGEARRFEAFRRG